MGGAGIQTDVKAMASIGVHCCTAVTALTVQNSGGVSQIVPTDPEVVAAQIRAVTEDTDLNAVKFGMLHDRGVAAAAAEALEDVEAHMVLDPVLTSTAGGTLSSDDLVSGIKEDIMPLCSIVTPNRMEAEILSGIQIKNDEDAKFACELIGKGGTAVLLKGGHMGGRNVRDILYLSSEFTVLEFPRLGASGHGSGCVLSSFIAGYLAKGLDIMSAVFSARKAMQDAVHYGYSVGKGRVVNPFSRTGVDGGSVLADLESSVKPISEALSPEWVLGNGSNLCFGTEGADGIGGIGAVEGGISVKGRKVVHGDKARFGVGGQLSFTLLAAMSCHPESRAALSLRYSDDLAGLLEEVGLNIYAATGDGNPAEQTERCLRKGGPTPDAVIHGSGPEPSITLFGKNPEDLLGKIKTFA